MTDLPNGWIETTLGEVIKIVGGGTPKTRIDEYWNGSIPWLSVVDFNNDNRWVYKAEKSITELGLSKSSTKLLNVGDIIISARGTVGAMAQLKKQMAFNQSCYGIREIENISNIDYLFYLAKYSLKQINRNTYGAVFDTITTKTFDVISINLPPIEEQKAIANILTAFDDKIELLQAQNKTLETTAQTIFKEWFGKYQIDDDLPEGWRVGKLGNLVDHLKDSIKPFNHQEEEFTHYSLPAYDAGLVPIKEKGEYIKSNKYAVKDKTFLVSKLNPFTPRIWTIFKTKDSHICSTEFQVLKPKREVCFTFLHCFLNSNYYTKEISKNIQGTSSSHQRVKPEDIFNLKLIIPADQKIYAFEESIRPLIQKKETNHQQIQSLKQTRDTLLPKLMSGQLRVNDYKEDNV